MKILAVSLTAALAAAALSADEARVAPLPLETALDVRSFADYGPVDLSPDGKWVAYTLKSARRVTNDPDPRFQYYTRTGVSLFGQGCDVWIADTETGEARNLTEGKGNSWYPVWSPDGRALAFYSDREGHASPWVWERNGGLRRLSTRIVRGIGGQTMVWTPDGKRLVVQVLPEGMTIEQAAELLGVAKAPPRPAPGEPTVTVFDARRENGKATTWSTEGIVGDVVLLDVATGRESVLAHGFRPVGAEMSPDGKAIVFASAKGFAEGKSFQPMYDLAVVALDGGAPRVVVSGVPMETGREIAWTPDARSLVYMAGGDSEEGKKGNIYVVPAGGGKPRLATPGEHPEFTGYFRQPLLDPAGRFVYAATEDSIWSAALDGSGAKALARFAGSDVLGFLTVGGRTGRLWSPDGGRKLALLARDKETKRVAAYGVDLASGAADKLFEVEKHFSDPLGFSVDASDDGKRVVFRAEDADHPDDLWIAGPNLRDARRLTRINPGFDGYRMGGVRLLEWTALDGEKLRGALLLPSGYHEGERYPTIVYPYGGANLSNRRFAFGLSYGGPENMQILATRGYAVFLPDTRTRMGTPMRDLADSVLSGVAKLIESGVADPERIGVMGHSYGGYSVLALVVQSKLFKAAIDRAGPGDLAGNYGDMGRDGTPLNVQWAEGGQGMMGGTPWEFRSRYIENSPYFYLDRVETPLLIIHGAEDMRVPVHNADQTFVALRRLGKTVAYARYDGEDHSELYWGYANQLDYCRRIIGWFDEYLKKPSAGAPGATAGKKGNP